MVLKLMSHGQKANTIAHEGRQHQGDNTAIHRSPEHAPTLFPEGVNAKGTVRTRRTGTAITRHRWRLAVALLLWLVGAPEVIASQPCPTGRFNFYTDNDPDRGYSELVIAADQNGNCSGAIGWYITNTPAYTELKLNAFSYIGGAWFEAWDARAPGDKYTIMVEENGDVQIFWGRRGTNFSGHARRVSQPLRKIRILNAEARPITDLYIDLHWYDGHLWDQERLRTFTGKSYFGSTGFLTAGNQQTFLYPMLLHQSGESQIVINKIDYRNYTGNIEVRVLFKIAGQAHRARAVLQNWSDSNSPEYIDFILETTRAWNSQPTPYWDADASTWIGSFLRPVSCPFWDNDGTWCKAFASWFQW